MLIILKNIHHDVYTSWFAHSCLFCLSHYSQDPPSVVTLCPLYFHTFLCHFALLLSIFYFVFIHFPLYLCGQRDLFLSIQDQPSTVDILDIINIESTISMTPNILPIHFISCPFLLPWPTVTTSNNNGACQEWQQKCDTLINVTRGMLRGRRVLYLRKRIQGSQLWWEWWKGTIDKEKRCMSPWNCISSIKFYPPRPPPTLFKWTWTLASASIHF